jgi:hypothetical protein
MSKETQLLKVAQDVLLQVTEERDKLASENAQLRKERDEIGLHLECEKVAAQMQAKGVFADKDFSSLVDHLKKEAAAGKLPVIKEALDMTAPNMGLKGGFIDEELQTAAGESPFVQYLVGSVG